MKKFLTLISLLLLLIGCAPSIKFVKTGKTLPPLAVNADVKVYMTKASEKYEEIGIIEAKGGDLEARIEAAKQKAREVGGTGLIVGGETSSVGSYYNHATKQNETSTVINQKFTVIKE